jgi:hypothetical protein
MLIYGLSIGAVGQERKKARFKKSTFLKQREVGECSNSLLDFLNSNVLLTTIIAKRYMMETFQSSKSMIKVIAVSMKR